MLGEIIHGLCHLLQIEAGGPSLITGPLASAELFLNIDHQAYSLFRLRLGRGPGGGMFLFSGQNRTKLGFTVPFAQLLTHAGSIVPARSFEAVRLPTARHLAAHPFQQLQQGIEVSGLLLQGLVDHHPQRLPLGLFGPIPQPLVIALSMWLRVLHNRVSVLNADGVIEPPDRTGAAPKIPKLPLIVQGGGIE